MFRRSPFAACLAFIAFQPHLCADSFDQYFNDLLAKMPGRPEVRKIDKLRLEDMVEHSRTLPGVVGTFVIVKTNGDRYAKLLVQPARQKISQDASVPIVLLDRFITFREGEERAVQAKGGNVHLFDGFRFALDLGQVVPEALGGDLRFVVDKNGSRLEPVGKAEMFLVTKHLGESAPKKQGKLDIGAKFETRFFTGTYHLHDDGRRSGKLQLKAAADGVVSGWYYSDKDGRKYEVAGKVGSPNHTVTFTITFPRTLQTFHGWMFTGDGRIIAGSSRMQDRETGFYAVRQD